MLAKMEVKTYINIERYILCAKFTIDIIIIAIQLIRGTKTYQVKNTKIFLEMKGERDGRVPKQRIST